MYRISYSLVLVLSITLLVGACSKKPVEASSTAISSTTDKKKLNKLFAEFRSTPQMLTVAAGTLQTVKGAMDTKLTFYPNSFTDGAGNIISSGSINLQLVEMYKPGDMISNRATTVTKDGLLVSGGQIYLSATQGGQPVYARKYGISYANASSTEVMALYPGNTANEDSLVTWGNQLGGVGTFCVTGTTDTSSAIGKLFYKFDSCTSFGWINCDRFYYDTMPKTNVFVDAHDYTFDVTNTQVYVVLPSINSVTSLSDYDKSAHRFRLYDGYKLPEGLKASFIVMANKKDKFYYFEKLDQTITTNMVVDASGLTERSAEYIKERLLDL
ncbi:MAG: hypothetical protein KF744_04905 [Taibaiella sp.]|nr:hypothetical protein [Taibaiella sp.]